MSLPKVVRQWFKLALNDLKTARALESMGKDYRAAAAFFCQQSVEKSIKGYLAFHKVRFPKTHQIKELLIILDTVDKTLANQLIKTKKLSKYAVSHRYPDAEEKPLTKEKVVVAVNLTEQTYGFVTAALQRARRE